MLIRYCFLISIFITLTFLVYRQRIVNPKQTVKGNQISDCRVQYDPYYKSAIISLTSYNSDNSSNVPIPYDTCSITGNVTKYQLMTLVGDCWTTFSPGYGLMLTCECQPPMCEIAVNAILQ